MAVLALFGSPCSGSTGFSFGALIVDVEVDETTGKVEVLRAWSAVDPGRAIVGNAGLLLTRIEYVKPGETKNFAVVDAAMNDLIPLLRECVGPLLDRATSLRILRQQRNARGGNRHRLTGTG